jgi:hypothetical protein
MISTPFDAERLLKSKNVLVAANPRAKLMQDNNSISKGSTGNSDNCY